MFMPVSESQALTGGLAEVAAFKVEMNSMLFHSVINGIYADKIRSPMRELATNARDGHAAAGKLDVPFDITLPSVINPTFSVRDYGCSLDHDDVMGLYSTMFASSKRQSNEAVGMIGLGSKSPFAYTSVFNVTTWLRGMKRHYSCFIGSDDVPQIALVAETPTNEPDGVEVSFAVKSTDVSKFRAAAPEVFFGFNPKPNILNEQFDWTPPTPLYSGDNWAIYDPATVPFKTLMARQGCVLYPIDKTAMNMLNEPLFGWAAIIDFPIGTLSVSTSREQLGYDERTRHNVEVAIKAAKDDMTKLVAAEIDAASTYLDACVVLQDGLKYGNPKQKIFQLLEANLAWNGQPLKKSFTIPSWSDDHKVTFYNPDTIEMGVMKGSISFRPAISIPSMAPSFVRDKLLIFHEPDDLKQAPSRMRTVILENTGGKAVAWIRGKVDDVRDALPGKEIKDLSLTEPTTMSSAKKDDTTRSLRFIMPKTYFWSHSNKQATYAKIQVSTDTIYVRQEGQCFGLYGDNMCSSSLQEVWDTVWYAIQDGILDAGTTVYFLNKTHQKLLDAVKMTPLHEVLQKAAKKKIKTLNLSERTNSYSDQQRINRMLVLKKIRGDNLPAELKDLRDQILATQKDTSNQPTRVNEVTLRMLRQLLPDDYKAAAANSDPLVAADQTIVEKYPLLNQCLDHYGYDNQRETRVNHYINLLMNQKDTTT